MRLGDRNFAFLVSVIVLVSVQSGHCFEIQLRETATCDTAIVRLSDVAVVQGVDHQLLPPLERTALAPAPVPSRTRCLTASEIRSILTRRGFDLTGCRFTGAPRVHVLGRDLVSATTAARPVSPVAAQQHDLTHVKQRLVEAVLAQLPDAAVPDRWKVNVELARRELYDLPGEWEEVRVTGLGTTAERQQQVTAEFVAGQQVVRIPVRVDLQPRGTAVMATRMLERGDLVTADDVELCTVDTSRNAQMPQQLEEVIGKQATRTIQPGQLIQNSAVQRPLLVQRRDVVDVVARSGSIVVRRKAQARSEGALGDMIQLETLDQQRTKLRARVVGLRRAEIALGDSHVQGATVHR